MWERMNVTETAPIPELIGMTTQAFGLYLPDLLAVLGIMQPTLLGDERYLWLRMYRRPILGELRYLRTVAESFFALLPAGEYLAEVDTKEPAHVKFLLACGFEKSTVHEDRLLMKRRA